MHNTYVAKSKLRKYKVNEVILEWQRHLFVHTVTSSSVWCVWHTKNSKFTPFPSNFMNSGWVCVSSTPFASFDSSFGTATLLNCFSFVYICKGRHCTRCDTLFFFSFLQIDNKLLKYVSEMCTHVSGAAAAVAFIIIQMEKCTRNRANFTHKLISYETKIWTVHTPARLALQFAQNQRDRILMCTKQNENFKMSKNNQKCQTQIGWSDADAIVAAVTVATHSNTNLLS